MSEKTVMKPLVAIIVLAGAAFGWSQRQKFAPTKSVAGGPAALASQLCANQLIDPIVDAYPQARMSEAELRGQTLEEGAARLKQFQDQLPGLVGPIVNGLKAAPPAWSEISTLGKRAQTEFRKRNWGRAFKKEFELTTEQTFDQMKRTCPQAFQDPVHAKYATFEIGASISYLGNF